MTDDTKFTPDMFRQRARDVAVTYARALRDFDKAQRALLTEKDPVELGPILVPNPPVKPKVVLTQIEEYDLRTDFHFWTMVADVTVTTLHGRTVYGLEIEVTRDDR